MLDGDELGLNLKTTATKSSNVGSYEITLQNFANTNYNIILNPSTYVITPRNIEIEIKNAQSQYLEDINTSNFEWQILKGSVVSGDNLGLKLKTNATKTSVIGTYSIVAQWTNTNYNLISNSGEYKIIPRSLTVNINNQSQTYGNIVNIDDYAYSIQDDIDKDLIGIDLYTSADNFSNVGDYIIGGRCDNPNFNINFVDGICTITQRKLTIKIFDQDVKRCFEYKLQNDKYAIVEGFLVNNDELSMNLETDAKWYSFGTHKLSATIENDNYDVTLITGVVNMKISITDYVIIALVAIIIIVVVSVIIVVLIRRKKDKQILYYRYIPNDRI